MLGLCGTTMRLLSVLILVAALLAASFVSPALAQNAVVRDSRSPRADRINKEMFVKIGGIDQWITIKGEDRNNLIVLFLHGGPGDALSPTADAMFAGWDKHFTLVQWDQRGAGRTYARTGPSIASTLTIDRMVQDGVEVAEFLTHELHKRKIVIVGGSWGSILGIYLAHTRPDLFYAYIGWAQIVNWQKGLSASYARVLEMARASGDQQAITALTTIGPPPWNSISEWPVYHKWEQTYQAKLVTVPAAPTTISAEYASAQERAQYAAADDFDFEHFWGLTLSGPLTRVDLPALGTEFEVPIFIIQGQEDLTAVPEFAKAYFDSLKAPRKQFYSVPGTGHAPTVPELNLVLKVLTDEVRPLALER